MRDEVLTLDLMRAIVYDLTDTMDVHADSLNRLDLAIGDGDHGGNMARGFRSVREDLDARSPSSIGELLRATGLTLMATVGGASGPLYSAVFVAGGMAAGSKQALTLADFAAVVRAAADALAQRGRCRVGDKTILDALNPAADTLATAAGEKLSLLAGLTAAAGAAHAGMEATIPLVARCGLAMQFGNASAGHQDPGATSCYLIFDSALMTLRRYPPSAG
jgi:dihydroxyacetone kinase-like protein